MMKRLLFLLCVGVCLLCVPAAMADMSTMELSADVPGEHVMTVTVGEHGAVRYGEQEYSEDARLMVPRFDSAILSIVPEYGYKLGGVRVSSGENVELVGKQLQISSMVEDLTVELSFVEVEWGTPTYAWSEDNGTVTANCVSVDDPAVVKTETVKTIADVTREPTCVVKGVTTYTATFADSKFTTQRKAFENLDLVDHTPVFSPAVPATDDADGTAKGTICDVCRIVLSGAEAIDCHRQLHTPEQLSTIEVEAFEGTDFQQIILSENVVSIGSRAFADCPQLALVAIPASVREIAADAFAGDERVTLQVEANSFAAQFAEENHIDYIIK